MRIDENKKNIISKMAERQGRRERRPRRPRNYRRKVDPFNDYDDVDFFKRYRFTKPIARFICDLYIEAGYGRVDTRGHAITDELMNVTGTDLSKLTETDLILGVPTICPRGRLKALTGLRYYGSGSMYMDICDSHGVSRSTVSRAVHRFGNFLRDIKNDWITMPSTREAMFNVAERFQTKFGMPRCTGAIDCTHIEIIAPTENEPAYVNRHWTHSLNVQACCDADMIFMSVDARRQGSCHDNYIFTNSDLGINCADGRLGNFFLLGDSGYALRPWVMTPYLHPHGQGQIRYNRTHKPARSIVERAFARLKMRLRSISKTGGDLMTTPERVSDLVMACCVLHNIAEISKMPLPADVVEEDFLAQDRHRDEENDEADWIDAGRPAGNAAGNRVREALVRDVFTNRN